MDERTPVTVLTGALGAGKTTLLNRLLKQPAFAGAAVLVNERGAVAVDHPLVCQVDSGLMLLNTGCLCCSARGALARALREMLPRARRQEIRRVVIETAGRADPGAILATLRRDPVTAAAYRAGGVIAVVDAVRGSATLDAYPEAVWQVTAADRIVLSKTDLGGNAGLRERLRRLNAAAPIVTEPHAMQGG